jgi:hypothetical protein
LQMFLHMETIQNVQRLRASLLDDIQVRLPHVATYPLDFERTIFLALRSFIELLEKPLQ